MFTALRISVILLFCLTTTGFSVSKHYCAGELISWSVNGESRSCCSSQCGHCEDLTDHYCLEIESITPSTYEFSNDQEIDIEFIECISDHQNTISVQYSLFDNDLKPPPRDLSKNLAINQAYLIWLYPFISNFNRLAWIIHFPQSWYVKVSIF